jgi:hypothetical protein
MDHIPTPDRKGLRSFALTTGAIVAALFGLFLPWLFAFSLPVWPWVVAGILGTWGLAHPGSLAPVYRGWMRVGLVLNWFSSRIILGTVFFLLITPIGMIMRLSGKDPMHREFKRGDVTYRTPSRERSPKHMEKPF